MLIKPGIKRPATYLDDTPDPQGSTEAETIIKKFNVLWRKVSLKKNKTWEGDGVLNVSPQEWILFDANGCRLTKVQNKNAPMLDEIYTMNGREIQVESDMVASVAANTSLPTNTSKMSSREERMKFCSPFVGKKTPITTTHAQRHDPNAEGAVVLTPTKILHSVVVIDPVIAKFLREHQREGVRFLFERVTNPDEQRRGAVLADEMGLGKTIQAISLIWTLLKQSPSASGPFITRAMVACPFTLVSNWSREIRKWLGRERIGVFIANDKNDISNFFVGRSYQVLLIGYERLRVLNDQLDRQKIDLVICDEGHRLKSSSSKVTQLLRAFPTKSRVILSGTPIQNDLGELYTMCDLVNPGILGSIQEFRKNYESPIVRGREIGCLSKDKKLSEEKLQELSRFTRDFIMRRTVASIQKHLPGKSEYVLFCRPKEAQKKLYRHILSQVHVDQNEMAQHLKTILQLRQVADASRLLKEESRFFRSADDSGKLSVILPMLKGIIGLEEKTVVVSHFTTTLDMLEDSLSKANISFCRLDGSTAADKRQSIIDRFNRTTAQDVSVFLLSAKSGGYGLNLVGASRLFMFDIDWNPAVDLQAMARIHRDGQTKHCYIYRLLTVGTIDEKIYQRQITKQSLSDSMMDEGSTSKALKFSNEELRDLFVLHESTRCNTQDLVGSVEGPKNESDDEEDLDGFPQVTPAIMKASEIGARESLEWSTKRKAVRRGLDGWNRLESGCRDPLVEQTLSQGISFIFERREGIQ